MKLIVTIKYGKVTQDAVIPVGKGSQTFKWLANAAAYRFVLDGSRNGRHLPSRARKYYQMPSRTQLLPSGVYSEEIPFLHPDNIIKDYLKDGHRVTVDLYDKLKMDEYGAPILSKWAFIAYRRHKRHDESRDNFTEEKLLEVDTFQRVRNELALQRKSEIEKPKLELMRKIMADQLMDDAMIVRIMKEDWTQIKASGILDSTVPDEEQQTDIRSFFTKYYVEITDLYKLYSAVNSGGGTHTLEYIELTKFITETGILGEEHSNAILRIFIDSHMPRHGKKEKPSIHSEINQIEFFVALIKIAVYKNITLPKKEFARAMRKKGSGITKTSPPSVPAALEMIYVDFLSPVLKNMPIGATMRAALSSPDVLLLFHDHLDGLCQVFARFAEIEAIIIDSTGEVDGSMTLRQFASLSNACGFLGGNETIRRSSVVVPTDTVPWKKMTKDVSAKDIRQIFSASQHDVFETEQEQTVVVEADSHHQEQMDFSEFLEAIARVGVLKFGDSPDNTDEESCTHYDCIRRAIQMACSCIE